MKKAKKISPQKEIKKLKDAIHAEMRRIALKRHGYCVTCGKFQGVTLQGGHLISGQKANTRFELMNVFTQCSGCNLIHERNPEIFALWFIKTYGLGTYEKLIEKSKVLKSWKKFELIELLDNYKLFEV